MVVAPQPKRHPRGRPDLPPQAGATRRERTRRARRHQRPGVLHAHQGGHLRGRVPPVDLRDGVEGPTPVARRCREERLGPMRSTREDPRSVPLTHRTLPSCATRMSNIIKIVKGASGGEPGGKAGRGMYARAFCCASAPTAARWQRRRGRRLRRCRSGWGRSPRNMTRWGRTRRRVDRLPCWRRRRIRAHRAI